MSEVDVTDLEVVLNQIRAQADVENIRITQHAQQEMAEEDIVLDEVLEAIATGQILENYSEHRRGACCLSTVLPRMVALCTLYARRRDQHSSLSRFMSRNHQSG